MQTPNASRFNGFLSRKTVETVLPVLRDCTGLKPGVNKILLSATLYESTV
jgi:hypothetical protein